MFALKPRDNSFLGEKIHGLFAPLHQKKQKIGL